jgi:hypothetical protein
MKPAFAFGPTLAAAAVLLALVPACSSKEAAKPACDPAQCGAQNTCIAGSGETKCRRACAANTDCPAGATCVAGTTGSVTTGCTKVAADAADFCAPLALNGGVKLSPYTCGEGAAPKGCVAGPAPGQFCCDDLPPESYAQAFCVRNLRTLKVGPKQFGAACNATLGLNDNPDCDSAQGFACYGLLPGDGEAYCTSYGCHSDRECAPTFYCATINVAPNVTTPKPTFHETTTACLKRDYCAPCVADIDCPSLKGRTQHCVTDAKGGGFCAPECTAAANCNFEAKCVDVGIGPSVCYPRAGLCVGDGSLCAPCRADSECGADGVCAKGQYTTERACAKQSGVTCSGTAKECGVSAAPKAKIGCTTTAGDLPANYCVGLYNFGPPQSGGQPTDIGCFTPAR